jgi:glycerophosphoryl diester phosphodiesterase
MSSSKHESDGWERPSRPLVIAHRGASAVAPENTLRAFRLAIALGADGVEFDVHLSADGRAVVIHDRRVDRTTNGLGPVSALTAGQLSGMDAGYWFDRRLALRPRVRARVERAFDSVDGGGAWRSTQDACSPLPVGWAADVEHIPTLEATLKLLSAARLARVYIELKGTPETRAALLDEVVRLVRAFHMEQAATLLSFHHDIIERSAHISPDIRTAVTIPAPIRRLPVSRSIIRSAESAYAREVALHFSLASKRLVGHLHDHGLSVSAWTANNKIIMRRLIACGVDSIMTNFTDRLRLVVSAPPKRAILKRRAR